MVEALPDPFDVGPYRMLACLGSGSFGTVYAGWRRDTEELHAVKVAKPEFSDNAIFPARFKDEIAAIKRVESGLVPKLIKAAPASHPAWMATELIPGPSLDKVIGLSGRLPEEAVWHLGARIAEALTAIHGCGIVHRDLRPKNVLLTPNGPRVIDFNLAHLVEIAHRDSSWRQRAAYGYMSPEEARDGLQAAEEPADIFALGATLAFAATGHAPFDEASPMGVLTANPNLRGLKQGELRSLLESCLLKEHDKRPSLDTLRRRFASRAGGTGRDRFDAVLPQDVVEWLKDFRDELARAIGESDPARLGWGGVSPGNGTGVNMWTLMRGYVASAPVRWDTDLGSWVSGPVAVHGGRLVATLLDGTVAVLRTADGTAPAAWRKPVDLGAALHAGPLLLDSGDGRVCAYVGAADGRVYSINPVSRRNLVVMEAATAIEGAPVAMDGRVCALSADGRVHSVDSRTGERKILFRMDAAGTGALSATLGTVFATDTRGRVYAIDGNDGRLKWPLLPTDGVVLAAALPVTPWLYVCGADGVLRQIGIEDGHQSARIDLGAPCTCRRCATRTGCTSEAATAWFTRTTSVSRVWNQSGSGKWARTSLDSPRLMGGFT